MEINIAEEETKWGFRIEEAEAAAEQMAAFPHLRLKGLMTSAPNGIALPTRYFIPFNSCVGNSSILFTGLLLYYY